jgi:transketolase
VRSLNSINVKRSWADLDSTLEHTRTAYGEVLVELGGTIEDIVVLDADLASSTQTHLFAKKFPHRFFQVGIAEGDLIDTAAGFAAAGKIPFASTFAIFASGKGWEQIRNTVAQGRFPLRIVVTHGGISVGEDGASHQALEDIAITRAIPNLEVIVPSDSMQTRAVIRHLAHNPDGPAYVRLTRTKVPVLYGEDSRFTPGRSDELREGDDVTIIACGQMVSRALEAAELLGREGVECRVINMSTIKPLDADAVERAACETKGIVTAEEHSVIGGLGGAVAEVVVTSVPVPVRMIGTADCFGISGTAEQLFERYGLTVDRIVEAARSIIDQRV